MTWRSMDSAPQDGTEVDLWAHRGAFYCDKWVRYPDMWFVKSLGVWRNAKGDIRIKPECVSHWMPRPTSPTHAQ